ncbi:hypothetical protein E4631_21535 [Hymenobacter sp. UV11]|uniref:hypothetical protein n=1 Tax=Hymenobacter sp. UV11 TaxID=1849735 RepID=UPI00105C7EB8|nr:hypothetical protein [Hymenobacter sp. UV11]TDN38879.1 hypothetical protein A8B98_22225 [Hymenobacter sp. UV11]TFZ63869.1 hypothetical protein E4631_21535 [Hymenobacter sp. UV11]
MNQFFLCSALLSALLACQPGVAQEVVQPGRPQVQPPRPPRPPRPPVQPVRPPYPPRPPQPPRPPIRPPRPPVNSWIPIATIVLRQPVEQAGAGLRGSSNNFRYLKLRVSNRPLTLDHLLVSYDYGPASSLPLHYRLLPGHDSRSLSLQLGGRRIRRLDLWYSSGGGLFSPATVTVLGLR